MAYDIEDAMADAEKEAQKEKKMAYYVGFLIMGKIILIMIIWLCYVFFIQRHVARSIEEVPAPCRTAIWLHRSILQRFSAAR